MTECALSYNRTRRHGDKNNDTGTQELFITLKKQYELAKIEEIKEMPVVNVLDPAVAPLLRTTPKRRQTVMLAGVVSLFLGVFLAFALQYTENVKKDGGSAAKLGAMREAVRRQMRWRQGTT
jgi:hypothetical protein